MSNPSSPWRPMTDAPKDGPFLAKLRDDLTVTVDGEAQLSHWAGRAIVIRAERDDFVLDAPTDSRWWFDADDFEGWEPLPGDRNV